MRTYRQRLDAGELVLSMAVGRMFHHNIIQMVGLTGGFHGIWLDMEHVGLTTPQLEIATLACRAYGMDSFCRVAPTDYATVSRCLEAGSGGIMAAQIYTVEQAEQFVRWSRFAPQGCRGLNTGGVDAGFTTIPVTEYTTRANEETFVLIQIETLPALECCEAIAALPGVDALFIGPADLSQSLGVTGQFFHEKCVDAIARIGTACRNQGKHLAAVAFNADHAQLLHDHGCRLISPTTDVRVILAGLQTVRKDFSRLFGPQG